MLRGNVQGLIMKILTGILILKIGKNLIITQSAVIQVYL